MKTPLLRLAALALLTASCAPVGSGGGAPATVEVVHHAGNGKVPGSYSLISRDSRRELARVPSSIRQGESGPALTQRTLWSPSGRTAFIYERTASLVCSYYLLQAAPGGSSWSVREAKMDRWFAGPGSKPWTQWPEPESVTDQGVQVYWPVDGSRETLPLSGLRLSAVSGR